MAGHDGRLSARGTLAARRALLTTLGEDSHFNRLFDSLPDVHFFAKDTEGTILFASVGLSKLYGFESEEAFIGHTDFDVLPTRLAEKFRRDDVAVMAAGVPLLGIVELFPNPQGIPDWYVTDKVPMRGREGRVAGVMGTIRSHSTASGQQPSVHGLDAAIAHLREHYARNEPIARLAELCHLSTRQFEVKFKLAFNTSPSQFRIRLRVMRACELLRTTQLSVLDVAVATGFYDQSSLARHFKAIMGHTPLHYRKRYG